MLFVLMKHRPLCRKKNGQARIPLFSLSVHPCCQVSLRFPGKFETKICIMQREKNPHSHISNFNVLGKELFYNKTKFITQKIYFCQLLLKTLNIL